MKRWKTAATAQAVAVAVVGLAMLGPQQTSPTRYCYAVVNNQPWSCYLEADKPEGHRPVWVGPQSKAAHLGVNR